MWFICYNWWSDNDTFLLTKSHTYIRVYPLCCISLDKWWCVPTLSFIHSTFIALKTSRGSPLPPCSPKCSSHWSCYCRYSFAFSEMLSILNCTLHILCRLASFLSSLHLRLLPDFLWLDSRILIILFYVVPQFGYPFMYWRTSCLLPSLVITSKAAVDICMHILMWLLSFQLIWVNIKECNCQITWLKYFKFCKKLPNCLPKWLCHFAYTLRNPDLKETHVPQCSSQHCLS